MYDNSTSSGRGLSSSHSSTVYTHLPEQQSEEQREEALLTRSDLWKTLFRGGYKMVGKLIRSLSGAHVSLSSTDSVHCIAAVLTPRPPVLLIHH